MAKQAFVARQAQLARLRSFLDQALASHGQVAFVVGEAGSGKTALIAEFARQAQARHKDLIFAFGNCNAETGIGDPYLPFREIVDQLCGGGDTRVAPGVISAANTRHSNQAARWTLGFLMELGPDLINILVPGSRLVALAGTYVAKQAGWLDNQKKLVEGKSGGSPGASIEQSRIFEQLTQVFKALAMKSPLVLVLDDLHWADAASASLLFHLARRVEGSRILVLGAYRPEEVELGRGGERHPLDRVLTEVKRYFGDVAVDLDRVRGEQARQFVDALVDLEPNHLDEAFRQALVEHTGGQPLFATELLRSLQERGNLQRDSAGYWVQGPELDWGTLPLRVEGVIEERIARLEGTLQETLRVGSVEGETFTAEVIAQVQKLPDRTIVGRLSDELDRRHHLVAALGIHRLGTQALSSYRFRHNLFQTYLYGSLDPVQRAYLHQDVGRALETLYGDTTDEIALQLARHFQEAAVWDKAVLYWGRAGHQAGQRYANTQAIADIRQALVLLQDHPQAAGSQGAAELYEALGDVLVLVGQSEEARSAYASAQSQIGDADRIWQARLRRKTGKAWERQRQHGAALQAYEQAKASLGPQRSESDRDWWHEWVAVDVDRVWTCIWNRCAYAEVSELARKAKPMVEQFGTPAQRASFFRSLVRMSDLPDCVARDPQTESYALAAVAASEETGNLDEIAQSLYYLGYLHARFQASDRALDELESALTMAERIGDPYLQLDCMGMLADAYRMRGKVEDVRRLVARCLSLARRLGGIEWEGSTLAHLAWLAWRDGNPVEAQRYVAETRAAWRGVIDVGLRGLALWLEVPMALDRGDLAAAINAARELSRPTDASASAALAAEVDGAVAAWDAGDAEAARAHLDVANRLVQEMGYL
jgi:adenylate cyclase